MNIRICRAIFIILWIIINIHKNAGAQGQSKLDSLLKQVKIAKEDTSKVMLLGKISTAYATQDVTSGIKYGHEATALALRLGWDKGTAIAYNALGNNHISASSFDSAIYYLQKSMGINTRIGYKQGVAQNLGNLGIIAYNQGNMAQTLEYFFKALKIFEDLEDKMGVATQLGNIGTIYHQRNQYAEAIKYDTLALQQYRALGDKSGTAIQLGNIGNVYDEMGNHALAAEYDLASYKIYKSLGNRTGVVRNLVNLSQVYVKMNDDAKAYQALVEAIAIEKELGGKNELATCYTNLGTIYLSRGTDTVTKPPVKGIPTSKTACIDLAINYLQQGIQLFTEVGNYSSLAYAYKMQSNAYAQQNNYKEALKAFQSFQQFNDSVFTIDNNVKIANLETQRAIDLKNKQIALDELAVEKKRNERGFFIIGMIVLFVVIGVIFRNYKTQKGLNGALHLEKQKVEERTVALDDTNKELNVTLTNLRETQQQLIVAEKQKENQYGIRGRISILCVARKRPSIGF